jgi:tetratricopeptide (TPR) repeat protein
VREDYAELLVDLGRFAEGEAAIRELLQLDPHVALYWWRLGALGVTAERPALLEEAIRHSAEIDLNYRFGQVMRMLPALARGDIPRARAALLEAQKVAPEAMATEAVLFHWAARDRTPTRPRRGRWSRKVPARGLRACAWRHRAVPAELRESSRAHGAARVLDFRVRSGRAALLDDPRVKQALVRYGFVAYWRETGWPSLCRPVGADDFECDTARDKPVGIR